MKPRANPFQTPTAEADAIDAMLAKDLERNLQPTKPPMKPTELKDLVAVAAKWRANGLITVTPSSIQSDKDILREKNRLCMARLRAKQKAK